MPLALSLGCKMSSPRPHTRLICNQDRHEKNLLIPQGRTSWPKDMTMVVLRRNLQGKLLFSSLFESFQEALPLRKELLSSIDFSLKWFRATAPTMLPDTNNKELVLQELRDSLECSVFERDTSLY